MIRALLMTPLMTPAREDFPVVRRQADARREPETSEAALNRAGRRPEKVWRSARGRIGADRNLARKPPAGEDRLRSPAPAAGSRTGHPSEQGRTGSDQDREAIEHHHDQRCTRDDRIRPVKAALPNEACC